MATGKRKKGVPRPNNKPKSRNLEKFPIDRDKLFDVLDAIKTGTNSRDISKICKIKKGAALAYVRFAFREHIITEHPDTRSVHFRNVVTKRFDGVEFTIIPTKISFNTWAAAWLLKLLKKLYLTIPGAPDKLINANLPYVAVGGGRTIFAIFQQLKSVLSENQNENDEIKKWLVEKPFCIVNATAGGQTRKPREEASKLACDMGLALGLDVGVYTVSGRPTEEEKLLIATAIKNTFLVLSGVGTPKDAQCVKSLKDSGMDPGTKLEKLAVEFLYHPFETDKVIDNDWLDVKDAERQLEQMEKDGATTQNELEREGFPHASLFGFKTLQGRPPRNVYRPEWPRYVVAVVNCESEDDCKEKAKSLFHLLHQGFLTHVCMPHDLAKELIDIN